MGAEARLTAYKSVLPFTSCVALVTLLSLAVPQFPCVYNGGYNSVFFSRLL